MRPLGRQRTRAAGWNNNREWDRSVRRPHLLPDPLGLLLFVAQGVQLPVAETFRRPRPLEMFVFDSAVPLLEVPASIFPASQLEPVEVEVEFEVSPDSKQVLIEGLDEDLVLTLATGQVERFPQRPSRSLTLPAPSWRAPSEFTYVRKDADRYELVLHAAGGETILSRTWPDAILHDSR